MVRPHLPRDAKQMLGEDFSVLLHEVAPFVEPRMDVYQTDESIIIYIELAGASKDDFSVKYAENNIFIEGRIDNKYKSKRMKIISQERFYGPFKRQIPLPDCCKLEQLEAIFDRGILSVIIPTNKSKED